MEPRALAIGLAVWGLAAAAVGPAPATAEIRAELAGDEAILSYELGPPGSEIGRAILLTRDGQTDVPLSGLSALGQDLATYLSLLDRRDGSEEPIGEQLHRALLDGPLGRFPARVRRLVLVPDRPLYYLPFAALRADDRGPRLAERFELSIAPSAESWLRLHRAKDGPPSRSLLALADPAARSGPGRLPHAPGQARNLRAALGGESVVLTGEQASEAAIKGLDLRQFRVVELAAHALVDEHDPERSGVWLAPGSPEEDGWLGYRELTQLDLHGPVILLPACRGGALGLSEAFFLAGSRSVIASMWTMRDDESDELLGRFARELSGGRTVTAALTLAQREMIARGAPAAAWAGLVVFGDGDRVLFVGTGFGGRWSVLLALAAAGMALVALRLLVARSR